MKQTDMILPPVYVEVPLCIIMYPCVKELSVFVVEAAALFEKLRINSLL